MAVNKYNYFSRNNNVKYVGTSQLKAFMKCPAAALAELKGEWEREPSTSLLIGSYVDAYFEGTLDLFKAAHPELFKRDGSLKAEYVHADAIIERVSRDELFLNYMSGQKQVVRTGYIEGVPVKIKMDSYHKGKMIVDLKIIKDFKPLWNEEGCYTDFIRYWGYDVQGAVYQAIEGHGLPFFIAAATKEPVPDLKIIQIPQGWLDAAMDRVRNNIELVEYIKRGEVEPTRCECCDYCKATKKLTRVVSAEELLMI